MKFLLLGVAIAFLVIGFLTSSMTSNIPFMSIALSGVSFGAYVKWSETGPAALGLAIVAFLLAILFMAGAIKATPPGDPSAQAFAIGFHITVGLIALYIAYLAPWRNGHGTTSRP